MRAILWVTLMSFSATEGVIMVAPNPKEYDYSVSAQYSIFYSA